MHDGAHVTELHIAALRVLSSPHNLMRRHLLVRTDANNPGKEELHFLDSTHEPLLSGHSFLLGKMYKGEPESLWIEHPQSMMCKEEQESPRIEQMQQEKQELFESLETYYKVFFLGEDLEDDNGD